MSDFDFDKLAKILALSTSDNDNEALAALRKANAILARAEITWEEFFELIQGATKPPPQPPQGRHPRAAQRPVDVPDVDVDWVAIIDRLLYTVPNKFHPFLESVQQQYKTYGRLTPKQEAAVRKFLR